MSFISLHTALSGLRAAQVGMDTAAHNVANANTEGFTRQRVDQSNRLPSGTSRFVVGTGVNVDGITRIRDSFLDARVRTSNTTVGRLNVEADLAERAESVIAEPELGLTTILNDLWASFEVAATRPTDSAARLQVINTLDRFAGKVRQIANGWDRLEADTQIQMSTATDEVNVIVERIAELNGQIVGLVNQGAPNDLQDQRDRLVDELTTKLGVTVTDMPNSSVRITLNGMALVDGIRPYEVSFDPTTNGLFHPSGVELMPAGEIGGYQSFLRGWLQDERANLDEFLVDFAATLNDQHALGFTSAGVAGGDLLEHSVLDPANPGVVARFYRIVDNLAPEDLALASDGGPPVQTFDGRNAQALADLRTATDVNGVTLNGRLRAFVTDIGASVLSLTRERDAERGVNSAVVASRRNQHGVSLDEEMVSLMLYQRAFEAAARVTTATDEAISTIVNRLGVVGR